MPKTPRRNHWWVLLVLVLAVCFGFFIFDSIPHFTADPLVLTGLPTPLTPTVPRGTFPPTWTPSPTPAPTVTSTPKATPTVTPVPTLPPRMLIEDIIGHPQKLPLDCEAAVAVNWAKYFGFTINELEFFSKLPRSDNPNKGFVGDVNGTWGSLPPDAYGVHAVPVAILLRKYGVSALEVTEFPLESMKREIAKGNPVIAWVVGHVNKGKSLPWRSADGVVTDVAAYEHTVIVIGYTETDFTILDGEAVYKRTVQQFVDSWQVLGNMGIIKFP